MRGLLARSEFANSGRRTLFLSRSCAGSREAESFGDGIVHGGTHLLDFFVGADGMHAVRKQNHEEILFWVAPNGGASESCVAEAERGKVFSACGRFSGDD